MVKGVSQRAMSNSKLTGKNLNGRYRVISALGTGGFGTTYLAEDQHRPGRLRCVIKQLQLSSDNVQLVEVTRRLFNAEAETFRKISHHEQIPELIASFEEDGQFFLVQEFIPGPSLLAEILSDKVLPEPRVNKLLKEVLTVLEFIHSKGVFHRNLKPDNIIHHQELGKWVLINFGSEKALKEISSQLMGQKKDSAAFIPPAYKVSEASTGSPSTGSDIYALGMICLQALTGAPPSEIERHPKTGAISWPAEITSQVSPKLRNIIAKMVFHDSSQRYSSATEVLQALDTSPAFPLPKSSTRPQQPPRMDVMPPQLPLQKNPDPQPPLRKAPDSQLPLQKKPDSHIPLQKTPRPETVAPRIPTQKTTAPIASSFNPELADEYFSPFPKRPGGPMPGGPKDRVSAEPSGMKSVFAQPLVSDSSESSLPFWVGGIGTLATLIAAGFVFWTMVKSDADNTIVANTPPAKEVPHLNAEQRALLQESETSASSQAGSKASKPKLQPPLQSETSAPALKENVPVPPPPALKIPTAPVLTPRPQPANSATNGPSAKPEPKSATPKQEPKTSPFSPPAKNEGPINNKPEATTAQEPASALTPSKPESKTPTPFGTKQETKQAEESKESTPFPDQVPVAKSSPEPSKKETPSPLPPVNSNSEAASPKSSTQPTPNEGVDRKEVAAVSPTGGRVDVSLVNATGTVVSYQVLGNTDERSLYADMRSNLRGLPAPANVSFYRPDRGPIVVKTRTLGPNKIEVTLRRGNGPDDDHSFLTVQESGKVILN
jgi:serine/threonine protein kinase